MKKHNGMHPQDIVVLLKIVSLKHDDWYNSDLAQALKISPSEISEVLNNGKRLASVHQILHCEI